MKNSRSFGPSTSMWWRSFANLAFVLTLLNYSSTFGSGWIAFNISVHLKVTPENEDGMREHERSGRVCLVNVVTNQFFMIEPRRQDRGISFGTWRYSGDLFSVSESINALWKPPSNPPAYSTPRVFTFNSEKGTATEIFLQDVYGDDNANITSVEFAPKCWGTEQGYGDNIIGLTSSAFTGLNKMDLLVQTGFEKVKRVPIPVHDKTQYHSVEFSPITKHHYAYEYRAFGTETTGVTFWTSPMKQESKVAGFRCTAPRFSPDGMRLAVAECNQPNGQSQNRIAIFDIGRDEVNGWNLADPVIYEVRGRPGARRGFHNVSMDKFGWTEGLAWGYDNESVFITAGRLIDRDLSPNDTADCLGATEITRYCLKSHSQETYITARDGCYLSEASPSPDGKYLACVEHSADGQIVLVKELVGNGTEKRLSVGDNFVINAMRWCP